MRKGKTLFWTLLVIVLLLVGARVAAPYIAVQYLNRTLADMGDYSGHLEDIDLSLFRGAYQVEGLQVEKVEGGEHVPFLKLPLIDISLSWRALLRGSVVASLTFTNPELNFVDGRSEETTQAGGETDWRDQLDKLVPIQINRIEIDNGTIAFRNFVSEPPVNLQLTDIQAVLTNLTNVEDQNGERVATLDLSGMLFNEAPLEAHAAFDPFQADDFNFALKVSSINLKRLNDFARAYANLDFADGRGEIVMELSAQDKQLTGYAKPLFTNVDVASWQQDVERQKENPFRLAWEGLTGLLSAIFTNDRTERLATRIDISGSLDNAEVSTWTAIINIVRNAFVEAFSDNFEGLSPQAEEVEEEK